MSLVCARLVMFLETLNAHVVQVRSTSVVTVELLNQLMRAYLPISHKDLEGFVLSKSLEVDELYAPTIHFEVENPDCDEEELEYLLSVAAGEEALELRLSEKAPGIVIALEVEKEQIGEHYAQSITLVSPLLWDQVQCALLAFQGDDELIWFATQEIDLHLAEWK